MPLKGAITCSFPNCDDAKFPRREAHCQNLAEPARWLQMAVERLTWDNLFCRVIWQTVDRLAQPALAGQGIMVGIQPVRTCPPSRPSPSSSSDRPPQAQPPPHVHKAI